VEPQGRGKQCPYELLPGLFGCTSINKRLFSPIGRPGTAQFFGFRSVNMPQDPLAGSTY
jgi:hypothetical protein